MEDISYTAASVPSARSNVVRFPRVSSGYRSTHLEPADSTPASLEDRARLMQRMLRYATRALERASANATSHDMHAYLTAFAEVSAIEHIRRHGESDTNEIERSVLQAEAAALRFLKCLNPSPEALRHAQFRFGSLMTRRVGLLIRYHLALCTATEQRFLGGFLQHTLHWAQHYQPAQQASLQSMQ